MQDVRSGDKAENGKSKFQSISLITFYQISRFWYCDKINPKLFINLTEYNKKNELKFSPPVILKFFPNKALPIWNEDKATMELTDVSDLKECRYATLLC